MVTESPEQLALESIGSAAGTVWGYLREHGPVTLSKLARDLELPRDMVMQGVGWLAREGKLRFGQEGRNKTVSLAEV
jgi:hypothetical protein